MSNKLLGLEQKLDVTLSILWLKPVAKTFWLRRSIAQRTDVCIASFALSLNERGVNRFLWICFPAWVWSWFLGVMLEAKSTQSALVLWEPGGLLSRHSQSSSSCENCNQSYTKASFCFEFRSEWQEPVSDWEKISYLINGKLLQSMGSIGIWRRNSWMHLFWLLKNGNGLQ